jgi:hypothetical protein
MKKKFIEVSRPWHGLSISVIVANKVDFFAGRADSWGISAEYSPYERGVTLKILNLYMGFSVWYTNKEEDND